jgi:hypothetical protein
MKMMSMFKITFQLFAFLMEIAMLVAIGYWSFQQGKTSFEKYALAGLLLLITIVIWGTWMAPNSKHRLEMHSRIIAETLLFLIAALMVYKTGHVSLAVVFVILIFLREIIAYLFKW